MVHALKIAFDYMNTMTSSSSQKIINITPVKKAMADVISKYMRTRRIPHPPKDPDAYELTTIGTETFCMHIVQRNHPGRQVYCYLFHAEKKQARVVRFDKHLATPEGRAWNAGASYNDLVFAFVLLPSEWRE